MLGGLTPDRFLERHWQKEPLLVRGALPDIATSISGQELTALACDPQVDVRLITSPNAGAGWNLRCGPFAASDLDKLGDGGWTLLLQEAERHVRSLRALQDRFRFVPNWRMDDVMVSYATDGGGVGPHIDRYDVFLIQGAGRRRWRIATTPVTDERTVPGIALPVLERFDPDREWVLEAGDLLYLPPRVAHEGVAIGESVTISVGLRVPDPRELYSSFLRQLPPERFEAIRYADPDLEPGHLGEIPSAARRRFREAALGLFVEGGEFDRWLGCFVTTPLRAKPQGTTPAGIGSLFEQLEDGAVLERSAPAHFAWQIDPDGVVQLFVGGEQYPLGVGWETAAELLCGRARLDANSVRPYLSREAFVGILVDLVLRGFLIPSESAD